MDPTQRSVLKRFANDPRASGAVYEVILRTFLKKQKTQEVHLLAAKSLAIDLLQEAWAEIEKFKQDEGEQPARGGNVGV